MHLTFKSATDFVLPFLHFPLAIALAEIFFNQLFASHTVVEFCLLLLKKKKNFSSVQFHIRRFMFNRTVTYLLINEKQDKTTNN